MYFLSPGRRLTPRGSAKGILSDGALSILTFHVVSLHLTFRQTLRRWHTLGFYDSQINVKNQSDDQKARPHLQRMAWLDSPSSHSNVFESLFAHNYLSPLSE